MRKSILPCARPVAGSGHFLRYCTLNGCERRLIKSLRIIGLVPVCDLAARIVQRLRSYSISSLAFPLDRCRSCQCASAGVTVIYDLFDCLASPLAHTGLEFLEQIVCGLVLPLPLRPTFSGRSELWVLCFDGA